MNIIDKNSCPGRVVILIAMLLAANNFKLSRLHKQSPDPVFMTLMTHDRAHDMS